MKCAFHLKSILLYCPQVALLRRHDLELSGARAQDEIFKRESTYLSRPTLRLTFRHTDIFRTAVLFDSLVHSLVCRYSCGEVMNDTVHSRLVEGLVTGAL